MPAPCKDEAFVTDHLAHRLGLPSKMLSAPVAIALWLIALPLLLGAVIVSGLYALMPRKGPTRIVDEPSWNAQIAPAHKIAAE